MIRKTSRYAAQGPDFILSTCGSRAQTWRFKEWRNVGGPVQIVKGGPWDRLRKEYEKDIFQNR